MAHYQPVDLHSAPPKAAGKSVFFLGVTGYIGGTVFQELLSLPVPPASITALTRDPKKAELLKALPLPSGTKLVPLVGSLSDLALLTEQAAAHDITVNCADADNVPAAKAILEGLKQRKDKTGHRPVLIHTSGTGTLIDNAKGMYPGEKIYTDLNPTPAYKDKPALLSIATLPDSAFHRDVDLPNVIADASGVAKVYTILPGTIWGEATGELFSRGISNSFSDQIPTLVKAALDRGQAGMVGEGLNIWPHVEIHDVGDLYRRVYYGALRGDIGHGTAGYYFATGGEYTLFSAASAIGAALVDLKLVDKAQPSTFTQADIEKYYGGSDYMGTNSRARADRSKTLGWRPKFTEQEDILRSIKPEAERIVKTFGKEFKPKQK